jgi:hypothetical protein
MTHHSASDVRVCYLTSYLSRPSWLRHWLKHWRLSLSADDNQSRDGQDSTPSSPSGHGGLPGSTTIDRALGQIWISFSKCPLPKGVTPGGYREVSISATLIRIVINPDTRLFPCGASLFLNQAGHNQADEDEREQAEQPKRGQIRLALYYRLLEPRSIGRSKVGAGCWPGSVPQPIGTR